MTFRVGDGTAQLGVSVIWFASEIWRAEKKSSGERRNPASFASSDLHHCSAFNSTLFFLRTALPSRPTIPTANYIYQLLLNIYRHSSSGWERSVIAIHGRRLLCLRPPPFTDCSKSYSQQPIHTCSPLKSACYDVPDRLSLLVSYANLTVSRTVSRLGLHGPLSKNVRPSLFHAWDLPPKM